MAEAVTGVHTAVRTRDAGTYVRRRRTVYNIGDAGAAVGTELCGYCSVRVVCVLQLYSCKGRAAVQLYVATAVVSVRVLYCTHPADVNNTVLNR